jgi:hypothetical protein
MELLIFADDWGRHPSSCQHLAHQLVSRFPITWVNTIGTRAPKLDRATLVRALGKLRTWSPGRSSDPKRDQPANLRVLNPWMWPWIASTSDRRINRALLSRQLGWEISARSNSMVAVTTVPVVADLIGMIPVKRWVYYCVDDFGQWPGLEQRPLRRLERDLIARADVLIAASERLQARIAEGGRTAHLLTHGVDLELWRKPEPRPMRLPGLEALPRPLVVFWGLIDRRLDLGCLACLSAELDGGTILLVGPEQDPDPALDDLPRVVRWPALPQCQLPGLAREAAVLIMPYANLPVTQAMQPLKLKEYLATNRPVVTTDLPATRAWRPGLDLAGSPEAFSAAVRLRITTGLPDCQQAQRARLDAESWRAKADQFVRWIGATDEFAA